MEIRTASSQRTAATFVFVLAVIVVWIGAWQFKQLLDVWSPFAATDEGSFLYWVAAKLIFWVLPSIWFIKHLGLGFADLFGVDRIKRAVIWGGGIGIVMVAVNIASKVFLFHRPLIADRPLLSTVNAVLVAPFVEELMFRGAVLNGLLTGYGFIKANAITAILFLSIHLPGWYFQGSLFGHFATTQAAAILLLGILFGYIAVRGNSLAGAILVHSLNNLTA